jgi:NAD(P)-dependent dehydrogenase (short-subunit alcohol dehydrogenase family)
MKINKKKALVTGGSSGIGLEIVRILKSQDIDVIVTGKSRNNQLDNYHQVDFSRMKEVITFAKFISKNKIDILINNAGINIIAPVLEIEIQDFLKVNQINCHVPLVFIQAVLPTMIARKWGRILNVCSIWSSVSKAGRASYSASKFGLDGITAAVAAEVASHNILVNSLSPGFTNTLLTRQSLSTEEKKRMELLVPIGRFAEPVEIAEYASWLVSEKNTYISGQNLTIDGGFVRT